MKSVFRWALIAALLWNNAGQAAEIIEAPPVPTTSPGFVTSAALHATVFGTSPQDLAPLPAKVPLSEINIELPWHQPVPDVLWFDRKLRVWLTVQKKPAPLAIVISGTGSDGNTSKLELLRGKPVWRGLSAYLPY